MLLQADGKSTWITPAQAQPADTEYEAERFGFVRELRKV